MNLRGKSVTLHDMSLRDGMHPKRHRISLDQMIAVATALDDAGMPLVEVTHGDGLGGASINYGFPSHTDEEYLRAVVPRMKRARVSALLLPGIGTVDHLRMAEGCGVKTIRVATHCTEADVSEQHIALSRKLAGPFPGARSVAFRPCRARLGGAEPDRFNRRRGAPRSRSGNRAGRRGRGPG